MNYVLTTTSQPGRKQRRRSARIEKAAKVAPRPVDRLRPVVRCPTIKYNRRVRAGRGFTFAELKVYILREDLNTTRADILIQEAGIPRKLAPTIGIAVDPRRQNLSEESLAVNVERLKTYKARLVLFPRNPKSPKDGEASASDMKKHRESGHEGKVKAVHEHFPISNKVTIEEGKVTDHPSEEAAYRKLRIARSDARLIGKREKRAKLKAEELAAQKK